MQQTRRASWKLPGQALSYSSSNFDGAPACFRTGCGGHARELASSRYLTLPRLASSRYHRILHYEIYLSRPVGSQPASEACLPWALTLALATGGQTLDAAATYSPTFDGVTISGKTCLESCGSWTERCACASNCARGLGRTTTRANTTTYGSMIAFSAYEFTGPTHARGTDYFELTALMQCTVILAGNTRASRDAAEAQKLAKTRLRTYPETQNTLENIILNTRSDSRGSSFRPA